MKTLFGLLLSLISLTAMAQGQFDVLSFNGFKVHIYQTNDTMRDASIIVEGNNGLITLEPPLFKNADTEFNAYIDKLGKPVVRTIFDYHIGGTKNVNVTFPEGMIDYMGDESYDTMMKGFQKQYGDQLVDYPELAGEEVPFGTTQQWAGVDVKFDKSIFGGMPGADIIIGGKVFFSHSISGKAHAGARSIRSAADIDKQLGIAEKLANTGAEYFVSGHGGLLAENPANFIKEYYTTMKQKLQQSANADAFIAAMKQAYPELQGEDGLNRVAQNLYK